MYNCAGRLLAYTTSRSASRSIPDNGFILLGKCKNLIHGCPSGGRLGQAFVHEAIYSGFLITINVAPKATAANPQQPGGFFLAQPLLCPIPETLFKSHFPDLL